VAAAEGLAQVVGEWVGQGWVKTCRSGMSWPGARAATGRLRKGRAGWPGPAPHARRAHRRDLLAPGILREGRQASQQGPVRRLIPASSSTRRLSSLLTGSMIQARGSCRAGSACSGFRVISPGRDETAIALRSERPER
jgi:hypothetical protein